MGCYSGNGRELEGRFTCCCDVLVVVRHGWVVDKRVGDHGVEFGAEGAVDLRGGLGVIVFD